MTTTLEAAYAASDIGWPTFPLGYMQKKPLPGSKGFYDATTDKEILYKWFASSDYNIGLAVGGASRLVVIDIDSDHGGLDSIEALQKKHSMLPATATVRTGGGWHLYYTMPEGEDVPPSAGKVGTGVDIRGTGSYVVYPPSRHPNGNTYLWEDPESPVAEIPSWMVIYARAIYKPEYRFPTSGSELISGNVIPMGQRNQAATRIAGYFRRFGFNAYQIEKQLRVLPFEEPLSDDELRLISRSVSRYPKENDFSGSDYNVDIREKPEEM